MNLADTAWVLSSAALVLFMTPGLGLFYGGMVRAKGVLGVLVQGLVTMGLVTVLWAVVGFSLVYARDAGGGVIGGLSYAGLENFGRHLPGLAHLAVPPDAVMVFQMMFAIITAALITGGVVDRMRFTPFVVLVSLWVLLVYAPLAHWVFSPDGWLAHLGVLDFAGGTVVEINSGFSTLGLVLVLGRRRGWPREAMPPHSLPLTVAGAGILWFGWFGFNAGSALALNATAVHAFVNTQLAAATGMLGWLALEGVKGRVATALGAVSGAIAGMVAITPACGFVGPLPALAIGAVAGATCAAAVHLKFRLRFDDSLDVLGIHGVGGLVGMVLLGLFAERSVDPAGANGLVFGGGLHLLGLELVAAGVSAAYAFAMTYGLARLVNRFTPLRVSSDAELQGLDLAQHGESAYALPGAGRLGS